MKPNLSLRSLAFTVLLGLFSGGSARATDYIWTNNATANWNATTAWSPSGSFPGQVAGTDSATITQAVARTINVTASALLSDGYFRNAAGALTLAISAAQTLTFTNSLWIGDLANGTGTLSRTLTGILAVTNTTGSAQFVIGGQGNGIFTLSSAAAAGAGTYNLIANNIIVADSASGKGTFQQTVAGSRMIVSNMVVGNSGLGTYTLSTTATNNVWGGLVLGGQAGGAGTVVMSGGFLAVTNNAPSVSPAQLIIGQNGAGTFTLSGGSLVVDGLVIATNAGSAGTLTWNAGANLTVKSLGANSSDGMSIFTNLLFAGDGLPAQWGSNSLQALIFNTNVVGTANFYDGLTLGAAAGGAGIISLGQNGVPGAGNFYVTNAASSAQLIIGQNGAGDLTLNAGSLTADSLLIATNAGGRGTFTWNAGAALTVGGNVDLTYVQNLLGTQWGSDSLQALVANTNLTGTANFYNGLTLGATVGGTGIVSLGQAGLPGSGNIYVTNATTSAQLIVGQTGVGRFTLNAGTLTVDQLLVTNVIGGAAGSGFYTNSIFTFGGGTLNTSNATTALAADIVIASNSTFTIGGTWNMNGGTNITRPAARGGIVGTVAIPSGSVTVNPLTTWMLGTNSLGDAALTIGNLAGGSGILTVNGGTMTNVGVVSIATLAGGNGSLIISNGGKFFSRSSITVGATGGGTGILVIADGGRLTTSNGAINVTGGALGSAVLSMFGGTVTNTGALVIGSGNNSSGLMIMTGGIFRVQDITLAGGVLNNTGKVVVTGGTLLTGPTGDLIIGRGGYGELIISNTAFLSINRTTVGGFGDPEAGVGTLIIDGATNRNSGAITLGVGSRLGAGSGAGGPASTGTVLVTGGGLLDGLSTVFIGANGFGYMTITNGGTLMANQIILGSGSPTGATRTNGGQGTLTISDGGTVFATNHTLALVIGGGTGSVGNVSINSGGLLVLGTNTIIVGQNGGGNLALNPGGLLSNSFFKSLNALGGLVLGQNSPGTGQFALATSLAVTNAGNAKLIVGQSGVGTLTLDPGANLIVDQLLATNGGNSVISFNAGTLSTRATFVTNNATFSVGDGVNAATLSLLAGTHDINDGVVVNNNAALIATGTGTLTAAFLTNTVGGTLFVNTGNLTIRTDRNVNAGTNLVQGGTLRYQTTAGGSGVFENLGVVTLDNGNLIASGNITNSGTLRGNGVVSGNVLVTGTGQIDPGLSIGTMVFSNDLTLAGTYGVELDGTGAGTADVIRVVGALTLTGSTVNFTQLNPVDDPFYVIATYGTLVDTFGSTVNFPAGYDLDYNYNSANQIALVAIIPEPSALALVALGLCGVVILSRRRCKN